VATDTTKDFVSNLAKGGVNIFDFRKTKRLPKDIFSIMTLILSVLQTRKDLENEPFVFVINEAHTYFKNGISKAFVDSLFNLIRRKRHGLNWLLLDTHLPEDLDEKMIRLADVRIMHSSDKSIIRNQIVRDLCGKLVNRIPKLKTGQCIITAEESSKGGQPILVNIRPRITKHGGATITAVRG